jgi:2-amino-4-hydroxy-6-hydroxymethyldihydropteridine diphosphokinase
MEKKHQVYLSLGANLGDRATVIQEAIRLIGERVGEVLRCSSLIETEPWGFESAHPFLNAAVCCMTNKTPHEVLSLTQQIERDLGKTLEHATKRPLTSHHSPLTSYKDRPIDIDILLYDDLIVDEPDLKIPHPLMYERDFVMIPLREILD